MNAHDDEQQQIHKKTKHVNRQSTNTTESEQVIEESNVVSFSALPIDTIMYIMQFYELSMKKQLVYIKEENDILLMKILFGYFANDNHHRTIVTVFPRISLHCEVNNTETVAIYIINLLVRVKTVVSLDLRNWGDSIFFSQRFLNFRETDKYKNMTFNHLEKIVLNGAFASSMLTNKFSEFIYNSTNVTKLVICDFQRDFSNYQNLISLNFYSDDYSDALLFDLPSCLKYLTVTKDLNKSVFDHLSLLPHLNYLDAYTHESTFSLNPNLTWLKLNVMHIDTETLIDIFKLKYLKTLHLQSRFSGIETEAFKYLSSNTSIIDFVIDLEEYGDIFDALVKYLVMNETIENLVLNRTHIVNEETEFIFVTSPFIKNLLACTLGLTTNVSIQLFIRGAVNLKELHLSCFGDISQKSLELIQQADLDQLHLTFDNMKCKKDFIIFLLKLKNLHSLFIKCNATTDQDLIPFIRENKSLNSLTLLNLTLTQPEEHIEEAAEHIDYFHY
jgi:hypothetical protein